jgi:FixJ family two-component response regulator
MYSHHRLVGVVDDDPRILESFEELLAAGGYEALLFDSAEAFLDANGFEQVDCLISDIGMPAKSGWDLLRIARIELPTLPVILITARDEELSREAIESRGARCLFKKPFDGRALLAALDKIMR